jgi:hypothetical protein
MSDLKNAGIAQDHIENSRCIAHPEVSGLVLHGRYNFIDQPERLIYIGENWSSNGYWHQFEKVGESGVWCEIKDDQINLLEVTNDNSDDEFDSVVIMGGMPHTTTYPFHITRPHTVPRLMIDSVRKKPYQQFVKRDKRKNFR